MKGKFKMNEKLLNDFLIENSTLFLTAFRNHFTELTPEGIDSTDIGKLRNLDISGDLNRKPLKSKSNGRSSELDMYFVSPALKIIFELKTKPVGFRGVAQAAYYNTCIGVEHDFVILIGPKKGPDYYNFASTCIKDTALHNVLFVSFRELLISGKEDGGFAIDVSTH